ncbi:extracellular solute-binding protein [bacterium]|nr:extracellular solute-binding protein [bacterium]
MQSKIKNTIGLILAIFLVSSLIFLSGCSKKEASNYKVNLEIWGIFDDSNSTYADIIKSYKDINPFVGEIKYRKFTADSYKKDLLDAMASGQGPDICLIHNTWLLYFKDKITPSPEYILGEKEFRDNFVDVAANDFLGEGKIYAAPLSVDSLALYYNKDLFNSEGIVSPPATWEEFNNDVKKLTRVGEFGDIIQSGAALGTAYNINRSIDILGLLMFQNGASIVNEDRNQVNFGKESENALEFYTQFARLGSDAYTWNKKAHYSIDAFYEGTAAMMLNYSWHYQTVKSKNAKLNFGVAPVPQISRENPANYANYWGLAVVKNKIQETENGRGGGAELAAVNNNMRIHEAWQFLKFLTTKNNGSFTVTHAVSGKTKKFPVSFDPAKNYLEKTGRPAARRDIIEEQKSDPVLGPFVYGNLIAKSWHQPDPEAAETILAEAIDSVNQGNSSVSQALKTAESRINQFFRR